MLVLIGRAWINNLFSFSHAELQSVLRGSLVLLTEKTSESLTNSIHSENLNIYHVMLRTCLLTNGAKQEQEQ